MGMLLALCSVLLVSGAQLLLRWSMLQLPPVNTASFLSALLTSFPPQVGMIIGLTAYGLSMFCWFFALRRLALSLAYPLLSLSYVLVWALAMWLPGLDETFHWGKLIGVGMIVSGVVLVCWRDKNAT